jgi:hypothetical protein
MRLLAPAVLWLALVAVGGVVAGCGATNTPAALARLVHDTPATNRVEE